MKDVVVNEVMKELNWKERVLVRIFSKTLGKIYKEGLIGGALFVNCCCPVGAPEEE